MRKYNKTIPEVQSAILLIQCYYKCSIPELAKVLGIDQSSIYSWRKRTFDKKIKSADDINSMGGKDVSMRKRITDEFEFENTVKKLLIEVLKKMKIH